MEKKFNLDSHKLQYHFSRIAQYQEKGDCYPLYMEVSPVGLCNHRCIFCAYDYIDYPNRHLDKERFLSFLDEIASVGIKSILYAGEGEPLIHKDIARFVEHSQEVGIDSGMYSNGELLSKELTHKLLPHLTFLRFSFNGGDAQTYAKIHKPNSSRGGGLMDRVLSNIAYAVSFREKNHLSVDLGSQFVLLPENRQSLISAVRTMKEIGVDFIAVKPFVLQSPLQYYKNTAININEISDIIAESKEYEDENFKVIFRENAFLNIESKRGYQHCRGCNFTAVLNSAGDLATCLPYWDKQEFVYGNIYKESFQAIWNGKRRAKIKAFLEQELDCSSCPTNCHPNAINEFLEEIFNPRIKHKNFI